ncbi:hypothetical protein QTG56_11680 [Rossellomorea sp. AcN35-11]|nr:hypothetical protein [Rossellomorea aquimaris]NMH69937.1 hypothetical protein [Bacillus sp. RO3]WJV27850.1 hypothetical protein QTG56_11680 [Rossellomorea sp. AcN35-11]
MKKSLFFSLSLIFILNYIFIPLQASAYSYGDPGEEKIAEAYKELESSLANDDWDNAKKIYKSYEKDFNLYFSKVRPDLEKAFEQNDKELLLESWRAALMLNIERRLHFAQEQFDDYGQAKLLLAKARGTFNVLEPFVVEDEGQEEAEAIYASFDTALNALGNPGLFGIGSKDNDPEAFDKEVEFIINELRPLFPIPSEKADESHLTEENLGLFDGLGEGGSSSFWLYFSLALILILIVLIAMNKRKNKQ